MSTFANPMNLAAKALQGKVTLSAPSLLAGLSVLQRPAWFSTSSNASDFTDAPRGISSGYGINGVFIPNDNLSEGNGMVFVWQSRLPSLSGDGGVWFRNIRDGSWGYDWRMILSQY